MGIASFVIGLICLILSPFFSVFLILPSILGLVLGIIDVVRKSKKKESRGLSIAGVVLSTIALVVCILVTVLLVFVFNTVSDSISSGLDYINDELESHVTEINAKIGEPATLNDVTVTLVAVDEDFKDYYTFAMVDDDCKILKADFEFENVGDYTEYVSYSDFNCYADKFSCDTFSSVEDSYFYASIGEGKKAKGSVYFEIPKDAETIEIEYDGSSYDGSKITFVVE